MTRLLWGIVLHQVMALLVPIGWLVPNLTLLGLLAALWRRPARWAGYAMVAALSVLPWGGATRVPVMALYGFTGWAVAALLAHVEVQDRRLQTAVVASAATLMTAGMLAAKGASSGALWGWGVLHVLVTVLALMAGRLVFPRVLAER